MSRTVTIKYLYPYDMRSSTSRFYMDWSDTQIKLNSSDTHPLEFKKSVPTIVSMHIEISAENTSGNVLNRSWRFYGYLTSWTNLHTFTMPSTGAYTTDLTLNNKYTKFAAVPSSSPSSSTKWDLYMDFSNIIISEQFTTVDLNANEYFNGVFPNVSGVQKKPCAVSVNMGGTVTKATKILANVNGSLIELPFASTGYYKTTVPDSTQVFEFIPPTTGTYRIYNVRTLGDHELRLFDSNNNQLYSSYFYDHSHALTGGQVYYIFVTHHYGNMSTGESKLFVCKE